MHNALQNCLRKCEADAQRSKSYNTQPCAQKHTPYSYESLPHTASLPHTHTFIWCKSQHLLHPYAPKMYTDANRCWKNHSKQADYWQCFTHREQTFIQSTLEKTWPVLYKAWRGAHSINSGWVTTWCGCWWCVCVSVFLHKCSKTVFLLLFLIPPL